MTKTEVSAPPFQELSPLHYLKAHALHHDSITNTGIYLLEEAKRNGLEVVYSGIEHIPQQGRIICAGNHFIQGPRTNDNDMLKSIGVVSEALRSVRPEQHIVWTPTEVPQPQGYIRRGLPPREWLQALSENIARIGVKEQISASAQNALRVGLVTIAKWTWDVPDLIPAPYDAGTRQIFSFIEKIRQFYDSGTGILAIFPEGKSTRNMVEAQNGIAMFSRVLNARVVPVSLYQEHGIYSAVFSPPMDPWKNGALESRTDYTSRLMRTIAQHVPPEIRGPYQ